MAMNRNTKVALICGAALFGMTGAASARITVPLKPVTWQNI